MERVITPTCHSVVAGERLCEGARLHLMRHGGLQAQCEVQNVHFRAAIEVIADVTSDIV